MADKFNLQCRVCRFPVARDDHVVCSSESRQEVCESSVLWYIKEECMPGWIADCITKDAWQKGKLNCPKCNGRLGSFNFIKILICSECNKHNCPPIHIMKGKVDQKYIQIPKQVLEKSPEQEQRNLVDGKSNDTVKATTFLVSDLGSDSDILPNRCSDVKNCAENYDKKLMDQTNSMVSHDRFLKGHNDILQDNKLAQDHDHVIDQCQHIYDCESPREFHKQSVCTAKEICVIDHDHDLLTVDSVMINQSSCAITNTRKQSDKTINEKDDGSSETFIPNSNLIKERDVSSLSAVTTVTIHTAVKMTTEEEFIGLKNQDEPVSDSSQLEHPHEVSLSDDCEYLPLDSDSSVQTNYSNLHFNNDPVPDADKNISHQIDFLFSDNSDTLSYQHSGDLSGEGHLHSDFIQTVSELDYLHFNMDEHDNELKDNKNDKITKSDSHVDSVIKFPCLLPKCVEDFVDDATSVGHDHFDLHQLGLEKDRHAKKKSLVDKIDSGDEKHSMDTDHIAKEAGYSPELHPVDCCYMKMPDGSGKTVCTAHAVVIGCDSISGMEPLAENLNIKNCNRSESADDAIMKIGKNISPHVTNLCELIDTSVGFHDKHIAKSDDSGNLNSPYQNIDSNSRTLTNLYVDSDPEFDDTNNTTTERDGARLPSHSQTDEINSVDQFRTIEFLDDNVLSNRHNVNSRGDDLGERTQQSDNIDDTVAGSSYTETSDHQVTNSNIDVDTTLTIDFLNSSERRRKKRRKKARRERKEKKSEESIIYEPWLIDFPEEHICPVCFDLFCEPHACKPCGHVMCEACLRRVGQKDIYNTPCPMCRQQIVECIKETDMIKTLREVYPDEYRTRLKEQRPYLRNRFSPLPHRHVYLGQNPEDIRNRIMGNRNIILQPRRVKVFLTGFLLLVMVVPTVSLGKAVVSSAIGLVQDLMTWF